MLSDIMALDYGTIIAYVVLGSILAAFGVYMLMRKMGSKKAIIQDLRNPRAPDVKYYFKPDKSAGLINLYSNLFTPIKSGILPPLDLRPFTFMDGTIYGVRGSTGNSEDDSIALLRRPMVSMVECGQQSKLLADAVQNTMHFIDACRSYHVGDEITFTAVHQAEQGAMEKIFNKHHDEKERVNGTISGIGYNGLEVMVSSIVSGKREVMEEGKKVVKEVSDTVYTKYVFLNKGDIMNAAIVVDKVAENPETAGLDSFFTPLWVVNNFGVVPVDDVNPILISQKEFIAEFNSRINDRVNSRKSWFEKNAVMILVVLAIIGLSISFAIESYAVQQFLSNIIGSSTSQVNSLLATLNATKVLAGA